MSSPSAGTAQAILLYGASGTYKTTQVLALAEHVHHTTGLSTRVISAETAGAETLATGIAMGYIEPLWISQDMLPRSAMRKLARGEWPVMKDGIPVRNAKGEMSWTNSLAGVGAYAWEGLTSISMLVGQGLKSKFASGTMVKGASEGAGLAGAGYSEEGETFGSGSQSQVGSVQDTIMEILRESPKNLYAKSGGKIAYVLFTAHEARGVDEFTGGSVYGPGTVGKAITGKIGAEVGTMIHLESESVESPAGKDGGGKIFKQRVWAYFRPHPDTEAPRVLWPAKPRVPPIKEALDALEVRFPNSRFELTTSQSIVDYLKFQEKAHDDAMKVLEARRAAALAARSANPATPPASTAGAATAVATK